MGFADCIKCWDTPCACGWEYRDWTQKRREELAAVVLGVPVENIRALKVPEEYPQHGEVETETETTKLNNYLK